MDVAVFGMVLSTAVEQYTAWVRVDTSALPMAGSNKEHVDFGMRIQRRFISNHTFYIFFIKTLISE